MTIQHHSHRMGNGLNLESMEWEEGDVFYLNDHHIVMRNWPVEWNPTIEAMKAAIMKAQNELLTAEPKEKVQHTQEWHMKNLVTTGFFEKSPGKELVELSDERDPMRCLTIAMLLLGLHDMSIP